MPAKSTLVERVKELGGDPTGVSSKNLLNRMIKDLEENSVVEKIAEPETKKVVTKKKATVKK